MDYTEFLTDLFQYVPADQRLGNFQDKVNGMAVELEHLVDEIPAATSTPKHILFIDNCIRYSLTQIYHGKISYEKFAAKMGMSRPHLNRRIRAHTGMTISEFLLSLRILTAKTLLDGTVYPVNLIGECCGMSTPSYFGVVFKKATGQTPEGYRRGRDKRKEK